MNKLDDLDIIMCRLDCCCLFVCVEWKLPCLDLTAIVVKLKMPLTLPPPLNISGPLNTDHGSQSFAGTAHSVNFNGGNKESNGSTCLFCYSPVANIKI